MLPIIISAIENDAERIFMEKLYRRYYSLMWKKALDITGDDKIAEEVVQETLLRLVEHIDGIMELKIHHLPSYISATVRNVAASRWKRNQFEQELIEQLGEDLCDFDNIPEDLYIHNELLERLEQTLEKLPEHYRLLLEAKYTLNMKDDEIAKQFSIPQQNVRTYIMRARRKAYSLMKEDSNV